MELTDDQKEKLGIKDERIDFYFKVENAVIDDEIFDSATEGFVFVVLSRYCNNNKYAYPSLNTLLKKCKISKPTLLQNINSLIAKGLLKKETRTGLNGSNESNLYSVQNFKKYSAHDLESNTTPSKNILLGVVKEFDHPSKAILPNKELTINKYIKNTTTSTKIDGSSLYNFLEYEEFSSLNEATKNNIKKNIEKLDEPYFRKIYNYVLFQEKKGAIKNFNGYLYCFLASGITDFQESKEQQAHIKQKSEVLKKINTQFSEPIKTEEELAIEKEESFFMEKFEQLTNEEKTQIKTKAEKTIIELCLFKVDFLNSMREKIPIAYFGILKPEIIKIIKSKSG
ncbi:MAG: helix-turn-helix domain-containing protein [Fusobacteriaceae bacterium]